MLFGYSCYSPSPLPSFIFFFLVGWGSTLFLFLQRISLVSLFHTFKLHQNLAMNFHGLRHFPASPCMVRWKRPDTSFRLENLKNQHFIYCVIKGAMNGGSIHHTAKVHFMLKNGEEWFKGLADDVIVKLYRAVEIACSDAPATLKAIKQSWRRQRKHLLTKFTWKQIDTLIGCLLDDGILVGRERPGTPDVAETTYTLLPDGLRQLLALKRRVDPGSIPPGMKDYHGTPLVDAEWEFMNAMDGLLREPLDVVNCFKIGMRGYMEENEHIVALGLNRENLVELPGTIGHLERLSHLELGNNSLHSLPDTLGQLILLEYLYLNDNMLETLPDSIGNLTRLEELDVANNYLTALPETFCQLRSLRALSIENNDLEQIPKSAWRVMRGLESLNASGNKVEPLPINPLLIPKDLFLHVQVSEHLDLFYFDDKVHVAVNGKEVLTCAFLVASVSASDEAISSIDELTNVEGVRVIEGESANDLLSPEEQLVAHASNLQAWVENDYDTHLLHSNIAFTLLKKLSEAGDDNARRVLEGNIDERIRDGNSSTRVAIILNCNNIITEEQVGILLADTDPAVREHAIRYCHLFPAQFIAGLNNPNPAARKLITFRYPQVIGGRLDLLESYKPGDLPDNLVEALATSDDPARRAVAATYKGLPEQFIKQLSEDTDDLICQIIAKRLHLPFPILECLANHSNMKIRQIIATRADLTVEIAMQLLQDPE